MPFTKQLIPATGGNNGSVDGRVGREGVGDTWTAIRTNAGNQESVTETTVKMRLEATNVSDLWRGLRRCFLTFDTAPIESGIIVVSASVNLTPSLTPTDNFSTAMVLTNADLTDAEKDEIGLADYLSAVGTTEYSATRHALANITNGVKVVFALNATAITDLETAIAANGVFQTGLRYSHDFDNTEPTWASNVVDDVNFHSADGAIQGNKPFLEVLYRIGPGLAIIKVTGQKLTAGDSLTIDVWAVEIFS